MFHKWYVFITIVISIPTWGSLLQLFLADWSLWQYYEVEVYLFQDSTMGPDRQPSGLLDTLNMETVRTIFTHTYPYPHQHSRHAVIAVFIGCLFFISSENMHTLIQKLDSNIKWWSIYSCLLGFFYFFSSPFIGKTIKPSYSNFSRW